MTQINTWQPEIFRNWLSDKQRTQSSFLWRAVESQHLVATMSLVDDLAEQQLLEQLLEAQKPPLPRAQKNKHYLLSTPFRYSSPHPSRFRRGDHLGIWYGAETPKIAMAEVGYWRWRFYVDSAGLSSQPLQTYHSVFRAKATGKLLDLTQTPWSAAAPLWQQQNDYQACQDLADLAREFQIDWIKYLSVRSPDGFNGAVLNLDSISMSQTAPQQTWTCHVSTSKVVIFGNHEQYQYDMP